MIKPEITNPDRNTEGKLSYSLPRYITLPVSVLEKISARLILPFALRLFFTPLKFSVPQSEMKILAHAEKEYFQIDHKAFSVLRWKSDGPPVLLIHGWSGRGSQFFKLIEKLREEGFSVIAINAPAHAEHKEKKTHLLEFVRCVEIVMHKHGPFHAAIGHSLGGMAIFNSLERNLKALKIVVIGSPANITNVVSDFSKTIGGGSKLAKLIIEEIEKRYHLEVSEISTDTIASRINPPGMIVHDLDDRDVPIENAMQLNKRWKNAQVLITAGFGHRKILMDNEINQRIVEFIK